MPPDETPHANRITTSCPACGKPYRLDASFVGRQARCKQCGDTFTIVPDEPALARDTGVPPVGPLSTAETAVARAAGQSLCAVCQAPLQAGEDIVTCPDCEAPYHRECWDYNGGCGLYGCDQAPETELLQDVEIPVSYWGKEEKNCPRCGQVIQAAAVRCRFCGATFSSAAPEDSARYRRRTAVEMNLPRIRKAGIWLLVFSVISCTAPVAAIIGIFWYLGHREEIKALPGMYSAMCKIAVGVAVAQTVLLIVMAVAFSIAGG